MRRHSDPSVDSIGSRHSRVVDACIRILAQKGLIGDDREGNGNFDQLQKAVQERFDVDQTAITLLMARLLYEIARAKNAHDILVVGSYQANSIVWLAGGCRPGGQQIGVDIDEAVNTRARANLAAVGMDTVRIICRNGMQSGNLAPNGLDIILLDADEPALGKSIYRELAVALLPTLRPRGILLAHDAIYPKFQEQIADFLELTRMPSLFKSSVILPIDRYGISISTKAQHD